MGPSIAQVMQYLIEECDGEMDMLLTRMIFAFPEACMLLEPDLALPCMYSDDWAWLEKSISSSASELLTPSSEGLPQAYFDINDDIFVRVNELIWTGTVTKANAGEAELCYYVRRKCWNSTFDDWMSYEQSLGHSVIANSTQSNLYRSNIYIHHETVSNPSSSAPFPIVKPDYSNTFVPDNPHCFANAMCSITNRVCYA